MASACIDPLNVALATTSGYILPYPNSPEYLMVEVPYTVLSPNYDNQDCLDVFVESASHSECAEEWTSAGELSWSVGQGVTQYLTQCCPTAYPFETPLDRSLVSTTVIDGTEYPVTWSPTPIDHWCQATSVEALSGKTIILTGGADAAATEVPWDYEAGILIAPVAHVTKYVYKYADATTTCFGDCVYMGTPTAMPAPTPAPEGTYVPPPSHITTQFTPHPSCLAESMKFLVTTTCNLGSDLPDWAECAVTLTGHPQPYESNSACYQLWGSYTRTEDDGPTTWYDRCPVGYTAAETSTYRPFDQTLVLTTADTTFTTTIRKNVVESRIDCCPDIGAAFSTIDQGSYVTTTTNAAGDIATVNFYVPPRCVATHVTALKDQDLVLTMIHNSMVPDKRKRQDDDATDTDTLPLGFPVLGVETRAWDVERGVLFAHPASVGYTVFHGTYTCFENCAQYYTYSYNNTDPNYTPTSTPSSSSSSSVLAEGGAGSVTGGVVSAGSARPTGGMPGNATGGEELGAGPTGAAGRVGVGASLVGCLMGVMLML